MGQQDSTGPAPTDPAFLAFLRDRLTEETVAATGRSHDATAHPGSTGDRGLRMMHELLWAMEHGEAPDRMSLGLLTVAYAAHPDFDPTWNRWRID